MFDIAPSEMMLVALVAIVFIGPKDLPRVMRFVGQWVGKGRTMARHFRTAMDDMVRDAELHEMEAKWKAENERIMREHADLLSGTVAPVAQITPPEAAVEHPAATPAAVEHQPTPAVEAQRQG
jgi:sec-independent protein translocase protein TatB